MPTLRHRLIKLANEHPELRAELLPLIRSARSEPHRMRRQNRPPIVKQDPHTIQHEAERLNNQGRDLWAEFRMNIEERLAQGVMVMAEDDDVYSALQAEWHDLMKQLQPVLAEAREAHLAVGEGKRREIEYRADRGMLLDLPKG